MTTRTFGRRKLLVGLFGGVASSAWSSASSVRSARSGRSRAASWAAPRWRAGARLVTARRPPIAVADAPPGELVDRVPRRTHRRRRLPGRAAAASARAAHRSTRRRRRARRLGRLLEDLHPRRLLGRAARHRHPAAGHAGRSSSARATSRRSTRRRGPAGRAVRPRARSRSSPSTSTARASWSPRRLRPTGRPDRLGRSMSDVTRATTRPHRRGAGASATSTRSTGRLGAGSFADEGLPQGVPEPLLVPVGRGRAVQLRRARRDGHLPHVVLRGSQRPRRVQRLATTARGAPRCRPPTTR